MLTSTDQLGNRLTFQEIPSRIISVVPSQTELLFDLGLDEEVVGITKFCIHPRHWFETKTIIGGTKNLNLEKIRSLYPDLIIANKEENTEEQITLLKSEFPVWISDIRTLEDAISMIDDLSSVTGKHVTGRKIVNDITSEFDKLKKHELRKISCAYLIWNDPLMTVGYDTFISDTLNRAGFVNAFNTTQRYPETSFEELKRLSPEVIMLSSEPFPFKEKHVLNFEEHVKDSHIIIVDGEMFSWYGSRLKKAPSYFMQLREKVSSAL